MTICEPADTKAFVGIVAQEHHNEIVSDFDAVARLAERPGDAHATIASGGYQSATEGYRLLEGDEGPGGDLRRQQPREGWVPTWRISADQSLDARARGL